MRFAESRKTSRLRRRLMALACSAVTFGLLGGCNFTQDEYKALATTFWATVNDGVQAAFDANVVVPLAGTIPGNVVDPNVPYGNLQPYADVAYGLWDSAVVNVVDNTVPDRIDRYNR